MDDPLYITWDILLSRWSDEATKTKLKDVLSANIGSAVNFFQLEQPAQQAILNAIVPNYSFNIFTSLCDVSECS